MNILFPDIHNNLSIRMAIAFNALGHKMIIPSKEYKPTHYGHTRRWCWNDSYTQEIADKKFEYKNVLVLSKEEILDSKPEIICIPAFECQFEIIHELMPKLPKSTKLFYYSGNDYIPGVWYPFYSLKNYLYADFAAHEECKKHQVPNTLYYRPYVPFDRYKPSSKPKEMMVSNFTCDFERNFNDCYKFSKALEAQNPEAKHIFCDNQPNDVVLDIMQRSLASISIKPAEGYGYSALESMGCGTPVFFHRDLSHRRSYTQWAIEGETAFYISSPAEYRAKLKALIDSPDYRNWIHYNCAQKIREYIDNCAETQKLGKFLENLQ